MGDDRWVISGWNWNGLLWWLRDGGAIRMLFFNRIRLLPPPHVLSRPQVVSEAQAVPWMPVPTKGADPGLLFRGWRAEGGNYPSMNYVSWRPFLCASEVWTAAHGYVVLFHFKPETYSCKEWWGMWLLWNYIPLQLPQGLPFEEILWQNDLYSQESFCEMNTGVFSLKQIEFTNSI